MKISFQKTENQREKKVIVTFSGQDWIEKLSNRKHDLANALSTLKIATKLLQSGYQFDDENAAKRIRAIHEAVNELAIEMDTILVPLIEHGEG